MLREFVIESLSVKENDLATKARSIIREEGIGTLVVTDENGKFSGIIERSDLLKIKDSKSSIPAKSISKEPLIYLYGDMDFRTAAEEMIGDNIFYAPVFTSDKDFLGLIGLENILAGLRSKGKRPKIKKVKEFMRRDPQVFSPETPISKIWAKMEKDKTHAFPIVNKVSGKDKLSGLISQKDMISHRKFSMEMNNPPKVKKIMNRSPATITPEDSTKDSIELMIERNLDVIPVVDQKYFLKGLIDKKDLLKTFYPNL